MKNYIILLIIFAVSCNNQQTKNREIQNEKKTIAEEPKGEEKSIDIQKINMLKDKINWDKIPIQQLPLSSEILEEKVNSGEITLRKYCCHPNCDKEYKLDELDVLFSNNTISEGLNQYEGNGHPSAKQGYFALRLPNIDNAKVLLYTYYDNSASDYKSCTIEVQIFDEAQKCIDKKIIQDAVNYECGWKRTFSIDKYYHLIINDISSCYDVNEDKIISNQKKRSVFKITNTGKIIKVDNKK